LISGNSRRLGVLFFTRLPSDRLLLLAGVQTIDNEGPYDEDNTDGNKPDLLADASRWWWAGI
jgi:hypothetical protein